ncbi:MAG TPA: phage holin family protein [Chthoniobacterales bacterium]|nr:phage holin family protein [Chthoniobacterales bacterium]
MAGETMRFRNPAGHAGLLHNLVSLLNSLAGFLESRLALFAKESKTALVHVLILVGCLAGAAVLALFGYIFLVASAIFGVAQALHVSWVKIALLAAGLHFVLAFVCVMIARSRMNKSMFEMTGVELKKDREWLKNLNKESRSTN